MSEGATPAQGDTSNTTDQQNAVPGRAMQVWAQTLNARRERTAATAGATREDFLKSDSSSRSENGSSEHPCESARSPSPSEKASSCESSSRSSQPRAKASTKKSQPKSLPRSSSSSETSPAAQPKPLPQSPSSSETFPAGESSESAPRKPARVQGSQSSATGTISDDSDATTNTVTRTLSSNRICESE